MWRTHKAGAHGKINWIASIIQGFQYDSLDGREPDLSCFFLHSKLGVLVAPRFIGSIEGGVDARLLWELERRSQKEIRSAAKIQAFLKDLEKLPYRKPLSWDELDAMRVKMLKLLEEST